MYSGIWKYENIGAVGAFYLICLFIQNQAISEQIIKKKLQPWCCQKTTSFIISDDWWFNNKSKKNKLIHLCKNIFKVQIIIKTLYCFYKFYWHFARIITSRLICYRDKNLKKLHKFFTRSCQHTVSWI